MATGRAAPVQPADGRVHPDIRQFFVATGSEDDQADQALDAIEAGWRDGYSVIIADILRRLEPPR